MLSYLLLHKIEWLKKTVYYFLQFCESIGCFFPGFVCPLIRRHFTEGGWCHWALGPAGTGGMFFYPWSRQGMVVLGQFSRRERAEATKTFEGERLPGVTSTTSYQTIRTAHRQLTPPPYGRNDMGIRRLEEIVEFSVFAKMPHLAKIIHIPFKCKIYSPPPHPRNACFACLPHSQKLSPRTEP